MMGWLWTVMVFALPLAYLGELLLQRIRNDEPVRYVPTIVRTIAVMAAIGFAASRTGLVRYLPRLPFDLPTDTCGLELAAMMLPGLLLVIAATRRTAELQHNASAALIARSGPRLAIVLAIAASTAIASVAGSPRVTPRAYWISAAIAALAVVGWIASELANRAWLPEARLGATRGDHGAAYITVVAASTLCLFAGLDAVPRWSLARPAMQNVATLVPLARIWPGSLTTSGDAVAYLTTSKELVVRVGERVMSAALAGQPCMEGSDGHAATFVYPDGMHVLVLGPPKAACLISFAFHQAPTIASLRGWLGDVLAYDAPVEITAKSLQSTFVSWDDQLIALDLVAETADVLADDRRNARQCALGRLPTAIVFACSTPPRPTRVDRFDLTTWPRRPRESFLLPVDDDGARHMVFAADGVMLLRWDPTRMVEVVEPTQSIPISVPGDSALTAALLVDGRRVIVAQQSGELDAIGLWSGEATQLATRGIVATRLGFADGRLWIVDDEGALYAMPYY